MSLLNEIIHRPVDLSYAEASRRPPEELTSAQQAVRTAARLVLAVALGLMVTAAILALRVPQPSAAEGRLLLQEQIAERSAQAEELQEANAAINAEISELQAAALEVADPALIDQLRSTELLSGAVAVEGPGLVVTLDDPEEAPGPVDPASRVQDVDLQVVTNGLWAAGAEAIAINGERLTAVTAIRGAGEAILVDIQPLVAPYRVEAVGDVRAMQTAFARSSAGAHLTMLSGSYGISVTTRAETRLVLPGAGSTDLRHAAPLLDDGDPVTSSDAPTEDGNS